MWPRAVSTATPSGVPDRPDTRTLTSDPSGAVETTRPPRMSRKKRRVAGACVTAGAAESSAHSPTAIVRVIGKRQNVMRDPGDRLSTIANIANIANILNTPFAGL